MSKLSEPLKAFINAAHARPNTAPAPKSIASIYAKIAADAKSKKVGLPAWLCASVSASVLDVYVCVLPIWSLILFSLIDPQRR